MALAGSLLAAGCGHPSPAYLFEPEPRAALAGLRMDSSRHPRLGADSVASGTVHMLSVLGTDEPYVALMISSDGGDTFGPPVRISASGAKVSSHGENSPGLIVTPDAIVAVWNEDTGVWFARSLSWGSSFEKPVRLTDNAPGVFSGYGSLGLAPNGDVYAVWLDARDAPVVPDTFSVYLTRSKDRGKTFGPNERVATGVCPCCRPNLAFGPKGEVLVFWRKVYPGNIRDLTVAVAEGGVHFGPSQKVAADNWRIEGCPDSGPATARVGGRVYVAWLTEASRERRGIQLSWSDDAGRTWAPAVLASRDVLDANYPSLSTTDDGQVVLAFHGRDSESRAGWGVTSPFVVAISRSGKLSEPAKVPGVREAISRPTVTAATAGRLFLAWTQVEGDKRAVFLSRARLREGS